MSWRDCADRIRSAAGRNLTDDQVADIFETVQRRQQAIAAGRRLARMEARAAQDQGTLPLADRELREAVAREADRLRAEAEMAKRHAALSVLARDRATRMIEARMAQGLSPRDAVLALFEGTTRGIEGGRHSIAATKLAYEARFVGDMMARVVREVPHAEGMLRDRGFLDDVVREMVETRQGGTPGRTGNRDAAKVARIFADATEFSRSELNRLGANIGQLQGWAGSQVHDADRIGRAGAERWIADTLPRLDVERTFPDTDDPARAMRGVWDELVFHPEDGPAHSPAEPDFRGPVNVARALARHRVLHFKSADDWLAYQRQYGHGHIFDGIVQHQTRAALNAAQMEILGPNPGSTLRAVLDGLKRRIDRDADVPAVQKAGMKEALTDNPGAAIGMAFRIASGATMMPVSRTMADIGGSIRAVQSLSKLGGAVISSITDLPTAVVNLRFNGLSFGEAVREQVSEVLAGRASGERRELAYLLGEGFDGAIGHIVSPFVANDGAPGRMQAAMSTFFRWTGLTWWTDANRAAAARILSAHLGRWADQPLPVLPERLRNVLRQQDITPALWDSMRRTGVRVIDGRRYLVPEQVADRDAQLALRRYFADEVGFAVLEADAAAQRFTTAGLSRGTLAGEAIRFVMQFKAYPTAFTQRVLGRALRGGEDGGTAGAAHIGALIAGLAVAGYAAMTAKDAIRGYGPRDPADTSTIAAALLQGGGAGIYGDFLFGEASRSGNSALESAAGPLLSDAARWLNLMAKAREGEAKAGEALTTALGTVPGANIFWLRPALDYLVLNAAREALSPGYLARQDQRRRKQFGQEPLLAPSDRMALDLF